MAYMSVDDFYEDDEPIEKIAAAFEHAKKGRTKRPSRGFNEHVSVPGLPAPAATSSSGVLVNNVI